MLPAGLCNAGDDCVVVAAPQFLPTFHPVQGMDMPMDMQMSKPK